MKNHVDTGDVRVFTNFWLEVMCSNRFMEESVPICQALGFDRRPKGNQVAKGNDWIEEI